MTPEQIQWLKASHEQLWRDREGDKQTMRELYERLERVTIAAKDALNGCGYNPGEPCEPYCECGWGQVSATRLLDIVEPGMGKHRREGWA